MKALFPFALSCHMTGSNSKDIVATVARYPLFAHARNLPEILVNLGKSGTIVFYPYIMTSRLVTNPLTFSCHESVNEDSRLDGL